MAISDWIIEKSTANLHVNLEITTPIDGTGSLRISNEAIKDDTTVATGHLRVLAGSPQSQFLKGKIRTLLKPVAFTDGATSVSFFGIMCMMNQGQVFDDSPAGAAYFAGRWGGTTPSWRVSRAVAGITGTSSFTHLAQGTTTHLPGLGDTIATELEWIYNPLEFGGVRLTFKVSSDDNFSNLATVYQVIDNSVSVLTTTVGEGLFLCTLHTATGPEVTALFDKTSLYELVAS